jgi:hypothetical protein
MIEVTVKEGIIEVLSPYNPEFVSFSHMRGGKWSKKKEAWMFDPRDEFAVRSALIDIYGTDDYKTCEKVDIRINLDMFSKYDDGIYACGLQLVWRKYPNRLELSDNVVVVEGKFLETSKTISHVDNTIIEARAIPKQSALNLWKENREHVEILSDINIQQLKDEKERLLKRITEINETIEMLEEEQEEGGIISDLQD